MEEKIIFKPHTDYRPVSQIAINEGWRLWLLFCVVFSSYLVSMPKTVMLEDDGLFIMSSYFLGIAHPPGYPLHTLIGHLFTQIPIGSVASRVHAMSGFFGALGCTLIALIIMHLVRSRIAAYPAAFMLAWSPVYWSQSIIAEVYTLNAAFFLLVLLLLLDAVHYHATNHNSDAAKKRLTKKLFTIAFFYGLSLTNHWPLMILSSSCYLIIAWPLYKEIAKRFFIIIIAFMIGLTPYLWMYLYTPPPPGYSVMGPINNLDDLWFYISRKGYSSVDNSLTAGVTDKLAYIGFFSTEAFVQLSPLGTLLSLVGLITYWKIIGSRISLALLIGFLSTSLLLILLLNFDFSTIKKSVIHVYFIPSYTILALWCAFGLLYADNIWKQISSNNKSLQITSRFAFPVFSIALIITLNAKDNFRHFDNWTKQYTNALLANISNNSVVFTDGEITAGPLGYFHLIENIRPDIELRNANGMLYSNRLVSPKINNAKNLTTIMHDYLINEKREVVFTSKPTLNLGSVFNGLIYHVVPEQQPQQRLYAADNINTLNFLLDIATRQPAIDEWVELQRQELIRRAIPVFVSLYLTNPEAHATTVPPFIRNSTQTLHGKLMLIATLLSLKTPPIELGDIDATLVAAKQQLGSANRILKSTYFMLSAKRKEQKGEIEESIELLQKALITWPNPDNMAIKPLKKLNSQKTE